MRAPASILLCVALTLAASSASAQAITIADGFPQRVGTDRKPASGIDRNDCVRPFESWAFAFNLPAGVTFDDLELWARADTGSCADAASRSGASKTCWHVATWPASAVSGLQQVHASSGAMLDALVGKVDVVDEASVDRDAACYPGADEKARPLVLDVLLFSGGDVVGGTTYEGTYATKYDRGMPAPPTNVTSAVDPTTKDVLVSWDARATPSDVTGYHVYCFDLTGVDAGCAWPAEVQKNGFVAYQIDAAPCAVAPATATSVQVQGLGRGRTYAMVVTSVDDADNTGPFSQVTCVSPDGNLVPGGTVDPGPAQDSSTGCACRAASSRTKGATFLVFAAGAIALFFRRRRRV